jgi:phosphoserine aminotransferase
MTKRVHNFSAGPAVLPLSVLESAQRDLVSYPGAGMSVMEMSHRSEPYEKIHASAQAQIRELMGISDDYAVLFIQGGASLQFSMVPMNLMRPAGKADYVITGSWSQLAAKEAQREGTVNIAGSSESRQFSRVPEPSELRLDPDAAYVHLTSNNTIFGTQWHALPNTGKVPLVVDMSSDIMSRPIDVNAHGLIYAGAQKNLGPAGVTLVIVRKDLLERAPKTLPTMLDYRTFASKDSMYNTPPCWSIYIVDLACKWLLDNGGLAAAEKRNQAKAKLVYDVLDKGGFYRGTVEPGSRSLMNIPFRLPSEALEKSFVSEATKLGLENLKGHRSVGGIRASIYNAMPIESVEALVAFMHDFAQRNA